MSRTVELARKMWHWSLDMQRQPGVFIGGLRCVNETNAREHWSSRQRRAKRQRKDAVLSLAFHFVDIRPSLPARVTLTRYGPRKLDSDNLAASLKHVRDGVADYFDVDDGSDLYEWVCQQETAPGYGVRIEIERKDGAK